MRLPTAREGEKYGLSPNQGVVITGVDPKGPLGETGFEVGDIILGIDGQTIQSVEGFIDLVTLLKPKQKISILVLDHRTGNTGTVSVMVR